MSFERRILVLALSSGAAATGIALVLLWTGDFPARVRWTFSAAAVLPSDLNLGGPREKAPRLEEMSIEDVERFLVQKALERFRGNAAEAARFLGLSRSSLYRRLQKYGLPHP